MRTSTALFALLLLTIAAGTTWGLWPNASVRPPTASFEPVAHVASDANAQQAEVQRRDLASKQLSQDRDGAPEGDSMAENNPVDGPVIEVRGVVRDAASSVAIEAASIVHLRSDRLATSDRDGTFLLRIPIDENGAVLMVTHSGYAKHHAQILPGDCCDAAVELQIDMQPSQLSGQIAGQVFDAEQQPLVGCQVELLATMRDSKLVSMATSTDQQGRFQLVDVPPGTQRVAVRADHHDDHLISGIQLQPRMTHDLGAVILQRFWWGSVRGQIVDDQGKAIRDVDVSARTGNDNHGSARTRSDAQGSFHLPRVAPGSVTLSFHHRGRWAGLRRFVLQPRETSVQDVRMPVGTDYVGGTVFVGGEPAYGYSADCEVSTEDLAAYGLDSFYRSVAIRKDGKFRLNGLIGKRVQLTFSLARPWVSHDSEGPVATNRLDHYFSFQVNTGATRVRGYVRDTLGSPIANVDVHPHDLHTKSARGVTGADGSYQLVVPTTAHSSMSLHASHPDFLTATHNLPNWDTEDTQIDFVMHASDSAAKLTIRALHEGSAIARALVVIRTEDNRFVTRGTTDARGQQSFRLGAGSWRLHVRHPDFVSSDEVVKLARHEQRDLDVTLTSRPRYSRILEVRSEPDQPLVNIKVSAWQKGAWVAAARTNELGQAILTEIPSGDTVFSVQPAGHARHELPQSVRWERTEPVMFLILPGLQSIAGTVYAADNRPAAFSEVSCQTAPGSAGHVHAYATTDRDGRFRIEHLVAGNYDLQAFVGRHTIKRTAAPGDTAIVLRVE